MLEKNKDYVEMRVSSTDCAFTQNAPTQISVDGCVYTQYMRLPDPGEFYILISKEKFEKMQADVNINAEIAKQWEINYDLLLKKIGFDTVEELVNYLNSDAECDTLREAIASLAYSVKFARDERRDLSKKLDECEKDYISERDKAEALQTENEQLKKKLEEFSPDLPGYREFLTALYPEADVEKIVWATKHIFGCRSQQDVLQSDLEYYRTLSTVQAKAIYGWKGATGCDSPDKAKERIKALNERIDELEADYNHLLCTTGFESEGEIEDALDECDHSTLRKALVDYEFDYEALLKLTGYKTENAIRILLHGDPHEYRSMRDLINSLKNRYKFSEANWQKATGCDTPGAAEEKLENYKECVDNARYAAKCTKNYLDNITF